ncbi:MAG: twin-arginine translocase TatA/TatE family subunit [Anaeromyxobacteraceae bacterium]
MPRLGMGELLVILVIVIVLFGASKLPQLGAGLGQGIRSFKKALGGDDDKDEPGKAGPGAGDGGQKPDSKQ